MIRLTLLLLVGIGVALMVAGRDLTPDEIAELGVSAPDPVVPVEAASAEVTRSNSNPALPQPEPVAVPVVAEAPAADLLETPAVESPAVETPVVAEVPVEPVDLPSVADEIAAALGESQVWYVTGNVVNVRSGPSTSFDVVGKVTLGEATEILSDPTKEWVKIRIQGDGVEGYMARRFLQNEEPNG